MDFMSIIGSVDEMITATKSVKYGHTVRMKKTNFVIAIYAFVCLDPQH